MAKSTATNLETELQKILDGLGELPGVIGKLGDAVARFAAALSPLQAALGKLFSMGATAPNAPNPNLQSNTLNIAATDRNTVATYRLVSVIDRLIAIMTKTAQVVLPQGTPVPKTPGAEPEGLGSLGKLAAVAAVAAAGIAVFAIAMNLAEKEFQKITNLVKLFNPGIVQAFQFALDNLGATIGRVLVPIIQIATGVVREWMNALVPVLSAFAPIIAQFAQAFGQLMVTAMQPFAALLKSFAPLIKILMEQFQLVAVVVMALLQPILLVVRAFNMLWRVFYELSGLGTVVRILTKAFEAFSKVFEVFEAAFDILETTISVLVDAFVSMLTSIFPFKDVIDALTRAVQFAIRNLYVFSVMLAKFLGLDGVVAALIDSVNQKANPATDTAAQTPALKTLDQLSKDLALASAAAGGAAGQGGVKNQQEFWQKTLAEMKAARDNGGSLIDLLKEIINAIKSLNPFAKTPPAAPPVGPAMPGAGGIAGAFGGGAFGSSPDLGSNGIPRLTGTPTPPRIFGTPR
jgi:hypothetical protein